jgi:hypothetical protein
VIGDDRWHRAAPFGTTRSAPEDGEVHRPASSSAAPQAGDQFFGFLVHANPTVRAGAWAESITVTEALSIRRR